jgi:hypothetical protein
VILSCIAEAHRFSFWRAVLAALLLVGIGAAVGLSVIGGLSFGWTFYWPFLGALLSGFVAWCLVRKSVRPMIPALAVQGGQLSWLLLGLFMLIGGNIPASDMPARFQPFPAGQLVDAGLLAAFIFWVGYRPSIVAAVVVGLYELSSFAVHASNFSPTLNRADTHGLIMHMVLNVLIIVLLFIGQIRIRRSARAASAAC